MVVIKFIGEISIGEREILKFYPEIKPLLDEIRGKGWSYHFTNVIGEAEAELDLDNLYFRLEYYPPRIWRDECEGRYEISAKLGSEAPAILRVNSIEKFEVSVSTEHAWSCVNANPLKREITYITGVLTNSILRRKEPSKLSEAREVYNVVKFFLNKNFSFKDKYVIEHYKELIDLFEKRYRFNLSLELVVDREDKVPGWRELLEELSKFFYERGLLMKLKEEDKKDIFPLFRKPIP